MQNSLLLTFPEMQPYFSILFILFTQMVKVGAPHLANAVSLAQHFEDEQFPFFQSMAVLCNKLLFPYSAANNDDLRLSLSYKINRMPWHPSFQLIYQLDISMPCIHSLKILQAQRKCIRPRSPPKYFLYLSPLHCINPPCVLLSDVYALYIV